MGKICRLYEIVIRDMILLLLERDGLLVISVLFFSAKFGTWDMDPFATFVLVPTTCSIITLILVTVLDPLTPSFRALNLVSRAQFVILFQTVI